MVAVAVYVVTAVAVAVAVAVTLTEAVAARAPACSVVVHRLTISAAQYTVSASVHASVECLLLSDKFLVSSAHVHVPFF